MTSVTGITLHKDGARSPLRIAIGLHSPLLGGSQINTIDLSTRLRPRGHDVVLFVVEQEVKVSVLPIAEKAGFDVVVIPAAPSLTAQAGHIRNLVRDHDSQIVHVYHEDHWLGPIAALALRPYDDRAVVVTNWMMENNRWLPMFAPLIVGTEALRDEALTFQRGPVWVLEPPVDVSGDQVDPRTAATFRDQYGIESTDCLAVLVTRVDRAMKLESILRSIEAVRTLDDPALRLVVVGDGDAMAAVRDRAAAVNAALDRPAVTLTGALRDPRPAYGAADIVLGMGGSAIRGLAFGRPVVVLGEGNFSQVFSEETAAYFLRHGFFGNTDDEDRLPIQLRSLLEPSRRDDLGAFGSATVRERFDLDLATERLEIIYRDALVSAPGALKRWIDVSYLLTYATAHRILPNSVRQRLRQAVPRLRMGESGDS